MFVENLLMSYTGVRNFDHLEENAEVKAGIRKRSSELGISSIINSDTGKLQTEMRSTDIGIVIERALHQKAKKVDHHFFTPGKKDVSNAIDFLELLGLYSTRMIYDNSDEAKIRNKHAGKMLQQLEDLRANMSVSKSALHSTAKTAILYTDKLFAELSLTERVALKDTVNCAEKILKQYFH